GSRRRREPARHVRRLLQRGAPAAERARDPPARAARPTLRPVRPRGGHARLMPRWSSLGLRAALVAAIALVIAALPRYLGEFRLSELSYVAIYFVALLGLNILTGYSGQISLGHGAFMGIGAYTTAILTMHHGWNDVATIPVAGLVAGVGGYLFGLPALRLAGVYLALATFARP